MMRSNRARASKSGEVKTASINPAESSFVMRTGYDRKRKPAGGVIICVFFTGVLITDQDIA